MYKYPPLTVRGILDPTVGLAAAVGMFLVSILIPMVVQTLSFRWVGTGMAVPYCWDCANYLFAHSLPVVESEASGRSM